MKKFLSIFLSIVILLSLGACGKNNLKMKIKDEKITLENEYLLVSFNESNGSINTIYNKKSKLYLVKDDKKTLPITVLYLRNGAKSALEPKKKTFSYKEINNSKEKIKLEFSWDFDNSIKAISTVSFNKDSDEVIFNVKLNNLDSKVLNVKYPIVGNVSYLDDDGSNDYLLTTFSTGYLINNPIHNMGKTHVNISGNAALYPYGFGSTMQFMAYYSKDKGGFHFETRDDGTTIKSFEITAEEEKLNFGIYHYVDDLSFKEESFAYDTCIKSLYEGNWYESAEIYQKWAIKQSWCTARGKNKDRTDLNKDLFEKTTLSHFVIPSNTEYSDDIYNTVREQVDDNQKNMVVPFYSALPHYYKFDDYNIEEYIKNNNDQNLFDAVNDNNDLLVFFEYTDIEPETVLDTIPDEILSAKMKDYKGNDLTITFGRTPFYFFCASSDLWTSGILKRDNDQLSIIKASGLYNDVGLTAIHPLQCFDTNHDHFTRINVTSDFYNLMNETFTITRNNSNEDYKAFAGQEMITEQIIPYIDFYQTRSASGFMGEMEADHLMPLLKIDVAYKIPLFEYIYSEYVGMRLDGYTLPITSIGDAYYYVIAYCLLNGYIAQYNYENIDRSKYDVYLEAFDEDMIRFLNTLGKAKLSYAKDYLTYPVRVRVPELNLRRTSVYFDSPILNNWSSQASKSGYLGIDPVVSSAYKNGNNIGIFLVNVLNEKEEVNFEIDANKLYGIKEGNVSVLINGSERVELGSLNKGKITINLNLNPRQVYMIEIK